MALADWLSDRNVLESQLGWSSSDYDTVTEDALEIYGVATEILATDLVKLHKIALYCMFKKIWNTVAFDYDVTADGNSLKRSQQFQNLKDLYDSSYLDAMVYLPEYTVTTGEFKIEDQNPYMSFPPYSDRVL